MEHVKNLLLGLLVMAVFLAVVIGIVLSGFANHFIFICFGFLFLMLAYVAGKAIRD